MTHTSRGNMKELNRRFFLRTSLASLAGLAAGSGAFLFSPSFRSARTIEVMFADGPREIVVDAGGGSLFQQAAAQSYYYDPGAYFRQQQQMYWQHQQYMAYQAAQAHYYEQQAHWQMQHTWMSQAHAAALYSLASRFSGWSIAPPDFFTGISSAYGAAMNFGGMVGAIFGANRYGQEVVAQEPTMVAGMDLTARVVGRNVMEGAVLPQTGERRSTIRVDGLSVSGSEVQTVAGRFKSSRELVADRTGSLGLVSVVESDYGGSTAYFHEVA